MIGRCPRTRYDDTPPIRAVNRVVGPGAASAWPRSSPCDRRADVAISQRSASRSSTVHGGCDDANALERRATVPREFRFIDLFAGIGGMRLGLEARRRRVRVLGRDRPLCAGDVCGKFRTCRRGRRPRCRSDDLPPYDVLAAGFPCQPFSIAGVSKKASLGREHGFADKKSGNLFFEIIRIAEATKPPSCSSRTSRTCARMTRADTFRVILAELDRLGLRGGARRRRRCVLGAPAPRADLHHRPSSRSLRRPEVRVPAPAGNARGRSCATSWSRGSTVSTC